MALLATLGAVGCLPDPTLGPVEEFAQGVEDAHQSSAVKDAENSAADKYDAGIQAGGEDETSQPPGDGGQGATEDGSADEGGVDEGGTDSGDSHALDGESGAADAPDAGDEPDSLCSGPDCPSESCHNLVDDDGDGHTDCSDSDCEAACPVQSCGALSTCLAALDLAQLGALAQACASGSSADVCRAACEQDAACSTCAGNATAQALADAMSWVHCAQQECPDGQEGCLTAQCGGALVGCVASSGGGVASCAEHLDCVASCSAGDLTCLVECAFALSPTGYTELQALENCIAEECKAFSADSADFLACRALSTLTVCTAVAPTCTLGDAPAGGGSPADEWGCVLGCLYTAKGPELLVCLDGCVAPGQKFSDEVVQAFDCALLQAAPSGPPKNSVGLNGVLLAALASTDCKPVLTALELAPPTEQCDNDLDDDGDQLLDCEDTDCADKLPPCLPVAHFRFNYLKTLASNSTVKIYPVVHTPLGEVIAVDSIATLNDGEMCGAGFEPVGFKPNETVVFHVTVNDENLSSYTKEECPESPPIPDQIETANTVLTTCSSGPNGPFLAVQPNHYYDCFVTVESVKVGCKLKHLPNLRCVDRTALQIEALDLGAEQNDAVFGYFNAANDTSTLYYLEATGTDGALKGGTVAHVVDAECHVPNPVDSATGSIPQLFVAPSALTQSVNVKVFNYKLCAAGDPLCAPPEGLSGVELPFAPDFFVLATNIDANTDDQSIPLLVLSSTECQEFSVK